jgi:sarcosine oxidase subunit beta
MHGSSRPGTGAVGADVIVIGAGVIGCSVALHLRRAGLSVLVLERERLGAGTSSRSFGLVWAQSKTPACYLELTLASIAYYPEFLASLGDDCDYQRPGGLILIETEEQAQALRALMAEQMKAPGFSVEFLDPQQARELEPALSASLLGATFSPHDGHLDPQKLIAALGRALQRAGVEVHDRATVNGLHAVGGAWVVETTAGRFRAEVVVNCAGVWAPQVARLIGVALPVRPVRGQVLVTKPLPPLLRHPTPDVRQAADGRVWMGTIYQPDDWDLNVREEDSRTIHALARRQVPALRGVAAERAWAGIRAIPDDGHPILGPVPGVPGYYVAVSHSGITLCPIIGKLLAAAIAHARSSRWLERFGLARFVSRAG